MRPRAPYLYAPSIAAQIEVVTAAYAAGFRASGWGVDCSQLIDCIKTFSADALANYPYLAMEEPFIISFRAPRDWALSYEGRTGALCNSVAHFISMAKRLSRAT